MVSSVLLPFLLLMIVGAWLQGSAAPQFGLSADGLATILRDERTMNDNGQYQFVFETSNGIFRQEQGAESDGIQQNGGWSYTSPEGIPVEITFTADQGGFQPVGALLPVAPQLPYQRTQIY